MTIKRLSTPEFVALMALHFAMVAFSIDSMLPGLPQIAEDLSPLAPNRAQLVLISFVLGMGVGTLFAGPISDAYGRKPVIVVCALIYIAASLVAWKSQSLEAVLIARCVQGIGAAGPRAVGLAVVRDLYEGREMARITSIVMLIFGLVPAVAPFMGAQIISVWGWRAIFLAFVVFALVLVIWLSARQPETLSTERRRALKLSTFSAGLVEVLSNRIAVLSILVLSLCFGMLFAVLVSIQPVFEQTFNNADSFPAWFALVAVLASTASIVNAKLVVQIGMRGMSNYSIASQFGISGFMALALWFGLFSGTALFAAYMFWTISVFFMVGLTLGNLMALALQPLGHIAGMASSVVSAGSTVLGAAVAAPIGQAFDGTPFPVAFGVFVCAGVALFLMRFLTEAPMDTARAD